MKDRQDGHEYTLGKDNQPRQGEIHMFEASNETVVFSPIGNSEKETLESLKEKRNKVFGNNSEVDARGFFVRSSEKPGRPSYYAVHPTKTGPKNPLEIIGSITGRKVEGY